MRSDRRCLSITHNVTPPDVDEACVTISFDELLQWLRTGRIIHRLFAFGKVVLYTPRLDTLVRPFLVSLVIRSLSRGACRIVDAENSVRDVNLASLGRSFFAMVRDSCAGFGVRRRARRELRAMTSTRDTSLRSGWQDKLRPLYLRTDLWFGVEAGGSVAHISGVLNSLASLVGPPVFFTSDRIPLVSCAVKQRLVNPCGRFWDSPEMPALRYNEDIVRAVGEYLERCPVSFIYHRYSVNNYSGAFLACRHGLPLVLEYNGSEVWISRNWGRPLRHERLSSRIELCNLRVAAVVTVVSRAMRDELIARGIEPEKILVNPNGVDTERYHPGVEIPGLKEGLGLGDRVVIGFIGTFGAWHGAEVLLEAYMSLLRDRPDLSSRTQLVLIGDGSGMPALRSRAADSGMGGNVTFTGLIPQHMGPAYLGMCDILAAPTLPNPDGSPFFGSPTKLFEYMAMGRAILASDLDQIGEVLEDGRTGLLVAPGEAGDLCRAMSRLVDDPRLRHDLGRNARQDACARHTWEMHTRRILQALESRLALRRKEGGPCG